MKYSIILLLLTCCAIQTPLFAQEIQINEAPAITQLIHNWVNANRSNPRVEGWRVQIMASTDRLQVDEKRNQFRQRYPDYVADWVHEKPYYKLRVGAFRSKQEAQQFISTLSGFPGAYAVPDAAIHPRDFVD